MGKKRGGEKLQALLLQKLQITAETLVLNVESGKILLGIAVSVPKDQVT